MREPAGLLPGSDDRPADAVVKTLLLMLQLSVIQAASVVSEGARHCGECPLWEGEEVQEEVSQRGDHFHPLAVETLGGWHPVGMVHHQTWPPACQEFLQEGTYNVISLEPIYMTAFYH